MTVLLGVLVVGCGGSPAPETGAPAPAPVPPATAETHQRDALVLPSGAMVAAPWAAGDGGLYLAVVESVHGGTASVRFVDDQSTAAVELTAVRPVEARTWNVGDRVLAVWQRGRLFPGTITARRGDDRYLVAWDDGSAASEVGAAKIIAF